MLRAAFRKIASVPEPAESLQQAAQALQLRLDSVALQRLLDFLALLQKWNRVYNLTALRDPQDMLTHHLYDSMAVVGPLQKQLGLQPDSGFGTRKIPVLDVGAGAGLPGVVLAICEPRLQVCCIDAVQKKVAFLRQVATQLQLGNLEPVHARVEQLRNHLPAVEFSLVTSRAFASLSRFVASSASLLASGGCWMAMKARVPNDEIAELPPTIEVFHVEQLLVPSLREARCLVWMRARR